MENINYFLTAFFTALVGNIFVKLLVIVVCADMIFGSLRAAKFRRWNSAVGIDGAIRKAGMLACVLLFTAMDMLVHADLLKWLPQDVQAALDSFGIVKVGITELFALLFILYEATSVLKNMLLCGIPVPAGMRAKLAAWLHDMTEETQEDFLQEAAPAAVTMEAGMNTDKLEVLAEMSLEDLRKLASSFGIAYQESDTEKELGVLIASNPAALHLNI